MGRAACPGDRARRAGAAKVNIIVNKNVPGHADPHFVKGRGIGVYGGGIRDIDRPIIGDRLQAADPRPVREPGLDPAADAVDRAGNFDRAVGPGFGQVMDGEGAGVQADRAEIGVVAVIDIGGERRGDGEAHPALRHVERLEAVQVLDHHDTAGGDHRDHDQAEKCEGDQDKDRRDGDLAALRPHHRFLIRADDSSVIRWVPPERKSQTRTVRILFLTAVTSPVGPR